MVIIELILVCVAFVVTILVSMLTLTGYRIGIVWKEDQKVKKASVPIVWVLMLIGISWLLYLRA